MKKERTPKTQRYTVNYTPEMFEVIENNAKEMSRKKASEIAYHSQYYLTHRALIETGATIIATFANGDVIALADNDGEFIMRPNKIVEILKPDK